MTDCFAAYTLWKKQKRIEQERKDWDRQMDETLSLIMDHAAPIIIADNMEYIKGLRSFWRGLGFTKDIEDMGVLMEQDEAMKRIKEKLSDIRDCAINVEHFLRPGFLTEARYLTLMMELGSAYGAMRDACSLIDFCKEDADMAGRPLCEVVDREILARIDDKVQKLHSELKEELDKITFPEGREKAVQDLEDRIHGMTFQDEV